MAFHEILVGCRETPFLDWGAKSADSKDGVIGLRSYFRLRVILMRTSVVSILFYSQEPYGPLVVHGMA